MQQARIRLIQAAINGSIEKGVVGELDLVLRIQADIPDMGFSVNLDRVRSVDDLVFVFLAFIKAFAAYGENVLVFEIPFPFQLKRNTVNPVWDETFDFEIAREELSSR